MLNLFRLSPSYVRDVAEWHEWSYRQAAGLVFLTWLLARRRLTEWPT